jgi:DNA-binding transcriptional LysR family regulator
MSLGTRRRGKGSPVAVDITLSPAHVNLVDEGLDLAIRIGVLEDSALVVRKLALSRLVLCPAPAYLREHGMPRDPAELAKHNCLCTGLLPWGDEWRLADKGGEVRVAVSGSFRSNNAEMLRAAALDGIGIAVLPTWQWPTRCAPARCNACSLPGLRRSARFTLSIPATG